MTIKLPVFPMKNPSGHPVLFQELEAWSPSQLPGPTILVDCGHGWLVTGWEWFTPRNSKLRETPGKAQEVLEVYTPPPSRKCPRNVHQKFGRKEAGSSFQSSFFRRELLVERGSSACKVRHYQQVYSSTSHPKWATVASLNISFFAP